MQTFADFLSSEHILALLIAFLIFLTTVFLVVKRWIGFSIALLLLLFSLAAGLIVNNQQMFHHYFSSYENLAGHPEDAGTQNAFHKQIMQAVEDLKTEVHAEKENLNQVMTQVAEIVNSIDVQKLKLQNFIEETRERFKTDTPPKQATNPPAA